MTLIYLVRHGETEWNRERRIQGSTDIPLNETGRSQARRTGKLLTGRRWDAIASSPLLRASETGELIAKAIGFSADRLEIIDEVSERRYGEAEGLDYEELHRRFPGDSAVPGRERRHDVVARAIPALVAFAERHAGGNVLVTTHGGVIRAILNSVSPETRHHRGLPITNGSVHCFRHVDNELELVYFDDPLELESTLGNGEGLDAQNAAELRRARA